MIKDHYVCSAESQVLELREVIRAMFNGVVHTRYMAYRLFVKDIKSQYAKSAFGLLWDFVEPLVLGLVFIALARTRVLDAGDIKMPYAVFVIYGLLLYQTFCESMTLSTGMIGNSRGLITHLNIPCEAIIISVI